MSPGNLYDEALETLEEQDPSGRPAPSNPYLETLDALDHGHTQRMRTAQIAAQATTPDRAAAVRRLASASGLAPEVVERNFDDLRKRVTVDATPYDRLIRDTPKLAGWLEDPHNAALAADDLEPLSTIERTLQIGARVGRALGTGPMAHSTSVWGLVRAGAEWADAPELAAFARGSAQVADHLRTRIRGSQAGAGFVERSVYSGVESLSLSIFSLPALLAGGPAAYLAVLGAVTGGESYTEAREEGLGVGRATAFGAGQGVIEAATELIPAKWFLADLVKQAPLRQVILHQLAGELPGEQAATALQDLNAWATLPSNEHKTVTDYVRERPGRQLETLIATIVAVGGQGAVIRSLQAASGKPHSQHVVEALGEAAEASTTRTRSPEALSALVSQAAEGGLVEVYAPVDTFTEYFSSKGEDPAALAEALTGDPDAYRAAQDGGTDLRIPMSRYVAHAAATEHTAFFGQELRLAPEEMNAREATAFEAALAAQAAEPTQAEAGPAAAVRTQVTAQLEAAGMPAATAARYAALYESTFGAMGERVGVDPVALYESYGLTIRREGLATDPAQQPSAAPDAPAVAPPVAAPVTAPAAQEAAPVAPGAAPTPGMNALHAEYGMEAFAAPAGAPPAAPVGLRDLRLDRDLPLDNRDTIGSMARMRAENPAMFRNMAAREIAFRTTRRGEMAVKEAAYQAGAFDTGAQIEETTPDVPAGPAVAPGVLPESDLGTGPELRDPDPERVAAPGGGAFPLSRARSRARDRAARRVPDSWRDHFLTLHDAALRDGYAGTADDLTDYYLTQVAKATEIANDLAETVADTGWRGLLVEIAALGGISRDKEAGRTGATRLSASVDMLGEFDWLMESLRAGAGLRTASGRHNVKRMGQQQMPRTSAGIKGAPGVLKATGGSSFDDMRDKLESDPRGRWKHYQDLNTFLAEFEDAVRKGHYENQGISIPEAATPSVLGTLEGFLDVRDNTRWWEPADTATSFDPSEFDQSLFDDLLEPPAVDTLETGEQQPRLPGAEAVRETETITPAFEAPFALTSEPATRTGKQTTLFQSAPEGQYRPPAGPSPEAAIAALAARPQAGAPDARAVPFPTLTDLESERLYASRDRIHVRRQAVRLDQIVATQHSFLPAVALDYLATPSEDLPNGIEYGGRVYLAGGHHRTIAAWAQGVHTIEMEVSPVVPELLAEVRTYFQPDDAVPVATLTGTELGEGLTDITDLRQAGLAYYTRALQHGLGAVERPGFGTVTFTNKGKRHVKMYSANPDKLRLIPALPAIIQLGAYGGRTTSYKPRADGFVAFHRFAAPVRLGDRVLQVSVLVGEDAQGNKFYDLDPIKEKARVNPRKQTRGPGPSEDGGTTLDQSIEDTAEDVNLTLLHAPERRGAIRFGADRQFTIDLFARADLSTFLHESGHFFLEVATDLAADVRRVDAAARTPKIGRAHV